MCSPHRPPEDRVEASLHMDTGTHQAAEEPWLSSCSDVPKRKSRSRLGKLKSGDGLPEEGPFQRRLSRSSMKMELFTKQSGSHVPCQDTIAALTDNHKNPKLIQSKLKFNSSAVHKSGYLPDDVKPKTKPVAASKTQTITSLGDLNPSSCLSHPAVSRNTQENQELSKGAVFKLKKADLPTPKNKRRASSSVSSRKSSLPVESPSVASPLPEVEADGEFEDYFSTANPHPIQRPSLPWLSEESRIQFPFQLDPVPGKQTSRRSETSGPYHKKRRTNESQSSMDSSDHRCGDVYGHPITYPHVPVPVPSVTVAPCSDSARPARAKSILKSTPEMDMDDFKTQVVRHRIPSNPMKGPQLGSASYGLQVQSEGKVRPHAMESE